MPPASPLVAPPYPQQQTPTTPTATTNRLDTIKGFPLAAAAVAGLLALLGLQLHITRKDRPHHYTRDFHPDPQ